MCQFDFVVSLSVGIDNQAFNLFGNVLFLSSGVVLSTISLYNIQYLYTLNQNIFCDTQGRS